MKKLLGFAAVAEAATGLALIVSPPLVARLLLGAEISGAANAIGRVAGIGLLSLGLACWPVGNAGRHSVPAFRAMLAYNVLATLYLLNLALRSSLVGPLLWPAVALHAVVAFLLAAVALKSRNAPVP